MTRELLPYYERELAFITETAREFAARYPGRAGLLGLMEGQQVDPHVQRLFEAFALIAGRIHRRLDDDFPELTDALLSVLYPHYLAPIPSLGIVQFQASTGAARGNTVPRHAVLESTYKVPYQDPVRGGHKELSCLFRTCYPVSLWPVEVERATLGTNPPPDIPLPKDVPTRAVLRLNLACQGDFTFAELDDPADPSRRLDRLRFALHGDPAQLLGPLYEMLFADVTRVVCRSPDAPHAPDLILSPETCLRPVGFEDDEGLLPYPGHSFPGYRLLTEFFAFPRKFFFFDLAGLDRSNRQGFGRQLEVFLLFRRPATNLLRSLVQAATFKLGCTPVVNLFSQDAHPITATRATHEYRIIPSDAHEGGMEVYSVDQVSEVNPVTGGTLHYQPFFSYRHGGPGARERAYWYASRRPTLGDNAGTDVFLCLVDLQSRPWSGRPPVLQVQTLCTNRNLAVELAKNPDRHGLDLKMSLPIKSVLWVGPITPPVRPPLGRGASWRLLSHLNLNHLSLEGPDDTGEALKEILRLYCPGDLLAELIDGLRQLTTRRVVDRVSGGPASGFARGVEVTAAFDREACRATGVFLFASVLERFLALYTTINSFSQLVATVHNEKGELKRWPPRTGDRQIL